MTDPTRVPDDERVPLGEQPLSQATSLVKADQLKKLLDTVDLMRLTSTPPGAGFVLGAARGRLETLRDFGMVTDAEYRDLKDTVRETFNCYWPDLRIDDSPGVH